MAVASCVTVARCDVCHLPCGPGLETIAARHLRCSPFLITSNVVRELLAFYDAALEEVVPARPDAETTRIAEIRRLLGGRPTIVSAADSDLPAPKG